jgi:hypothetical protein
MIGLHETKSRNPMSSPHSQILFPGSGSAAQTSESGFAPNPWLTPINAFAFSDCDSIQ